MLKLATVICESALEPCRQFPLEMDRLGFDSKPRYDFWISALKSHAVYSQIKKHLNSR
jgi:hypothetical protein